MFKPCSQLSVTFLALVACASAFHTPPLIKSLRGSPCRASCRQAPRLLTIQMMKKQHTYTEEDLEKLGKHAGTDMPLVTCSEDVRIGLGTLLKEESIWDIAFHRVQETVGDALSGSHSLPEDGKKKRVVIVGSGWGANALMKTLDTTVHEVIVVSPRNYFVFTPMLASSAVGTVEYRSIIEPVRWANSNLEYQEAMAMDVDTKRKVVHCKAVAEKRDLEVPYDLLVLSVGMKTSTFGVPGVKENCHFLKEIEHARALRTAIIENCEAASLEDVSEERKRELLTFVVVGGGPAGVEMSGELFDFLNEDLKKIYPKLVPYVSTKLVESGGTLIPQFDTPLQKKTIEAFKARGTELYLGCRVEQVSKDEIFFHYSKLAPGEEKVTKSFKYGICVWATGVSAQPFTQDFVTKFQSEIQSGNKGRILVDDWCRALGIEDGSIFAIGDCSKCESGSLPQTAQVAAQQGEYVGRLINNQLMSKGKDHSSAYGWKITSAIKESAKKGNPLAKKLVRNDITFARPFQFLNLGILAYIGGSSALAQVEIGVEESDFEINPEKPDPNPKDGTKYFQAKDGTVWRRLVITEQTGKAGWFLWRSVYITKQVAMRNRLLVAIDWLKSRTFGRDIAIFQSGSRQQNDTF